jgi:thiamine kinase-like enzyme
LVKSGVTWCAHGASNHHIARELDAHEKWLAPWVATGRAPRLVAGDRTAKILVTEFLAGELVLGSRAQECLDTFRQAGGSWQSFTLNRDLVTRRTRRTRTPKVLRILDKPHRIAAAAEARLREIVSSWPAEPVVLVPTHGDWQPRNWLNRPHGSGSGCARPSTRPSGHTWSAISGSRLRVTQ